MALDDLVQARKDLLIGNELGKKAGEDLARQKYFEGALGKGNYNGSPKQQMQAIEHYQRVARDMFIGTWNDADARNELLNGLKDEIVGNYAGFKPVNVGDEDAFKAHKKAHQAFLLLQQYQNSEGKVTEDLGKEIINVVRKEVEAQYSQGAFGKYVKDETKEGLVEIRMNAILGNKNAVAGYLSSIVENASKTFEEQFPEDNRKTHILSYMGRVFDAVATDDDSTFQLVQELLSLKEQQ